MSRAKKLLLVSFVLALGIGLAWPFRRSTTKFAPAKQTDVPSATASDLVSFKNRRIATSLGTVDSSPAPGRHVVAKMAIAAENDSKAPSQTDFDRENHAALVSQANDRPSPTIDAQDHQASVNSDFKRGTLNVFTGEGRAARPAYSTSRVALADKAAWPEEIVHIVRNGDTLEKLAERYLSDAGRALELFDLNRDQLVNPHLLPIGAELRIPIPPRRELD